MVNTHDNTDLLAMYEEMLRIRTFELTCLSLRKVDKIAGSIHLCVGQESVPVGALRALGSADPVIATYRGHGWAIACGVPMETLFAEIMGRQTGSNAGRGGSAYLSDPGGRFIGENSIVAAGTPIAAGLALAAKVRHQEHVSVVSFGDGATNQGSLHEALVLAIAEDLPVIFICENNYWSEMTPITHMVPAKLSDRAGGYGLMTRQLSGTDPTAVRQAVEEARAHALAGGGPSFLEFDVPRMMGHYNADIEHYRSDSDKATAQDRDPLALCRVRLATAGYSEDKITGCETRVVAEVEEAKLRALAAPIAKWGVDPWAQTGPTSYPKLGPLPTEGKTVAFGLAINEALRDAMTRDPNVVVLGEDVAIPGGVFGVTRNLLKEFGSDRVLDTPISESAILGAALGASIGGLRPVAEIMWADFLLVALDQLVNQAANVRFLGLDKVSAPMVVRTQQGATPGSCAQHSQSLEALLAHIPGLKVGLPSSVQDAYDMTLAALNDPDPVVLIESRAMYLMKEPLDTSSSPQSVGGGRLRRQGSGGVLISWGRMVHECVTAAEALSKDGYDFAVLDLRWLSPLDRNLINDTVQLANGNVIVVHEANRTGGFGAEIAAHVSEACWGTLAGPVRRIATPDSRIPAAPSLQNSLIPNAQRIQQEILKVIRSR